MRETRALLSDYLQRVAAHQTSALLTLVYWTAVAVAALMARVTRRGLLPDTFGRPGSHWIPRAPFARDQRSLSRQF